MVFVTDIFASGQAVVRNEKNSSLKIETEQENHLHCRTIKVTEIKVASVYIIYRKDGQIVRR